MAGKLNALRVRALVQPGTYGDGGGLYLQVRGPGARSWLYRDKLHGKARLMGLGVLADVSLAEAREVAAAARKQVRAGIDPIDARRLGRAAAAAAHGRHTFREVAAAYTAAHAAGWRNPKHRQQWTNTLATYADPIMGGLPVAAITLGEVTRVLEPIWTVKPETASRLRGRIEAVLDYAAVRGWRAAENPARWKGNLDKVLPARGKVRRVKHHAALPWREVPTFTAALAQQPGMAALALRFAILCASRTGEVTGARWRELDLEAGTWTVPAERMKAGREHRIPLAEPARAILSEIYTQSGTAPDTPVFPGNKPRRGLSNMAMLALLRRMDRADITSHGFRSSFRDWASEATSYPAEVAEAALAHVRGDKTAAAYARSDLFDRRRGLMAEWAEHCTRSSPIAGEVVPIRKAAP